jgi:hypothetical protein
MISQYVLQHPFLSVCIIGQGGGSGAGVPPFSSLSKEGVRGRGAEGVPRFLRGVWCGLGELENSIFWEAERTPDFPERKLIVAARPEKSKIACRGLDTSSRPQPALRRRDSPSGGTTGKVRSTLALPLKKPQSGRAKVERTFPVVAPEGVSGPRRACRGLADVSRPRRDDSEGFRPPWGRRLISVLENMGCVLL